MSHKDYLMPFGWGENEPQPKTGRPQHPVIRLKINEIYIPTDPLDKDRAQCTATRLRKKGVMDVKYANGMFTRVK